MLSEKWDLKYGQALSRIRERIKKVRGVVVAYGTCIDGIHQVREKNLSKIFEGRPGLEKTVLEKIKHPPNEIRSSMDFLAGLLLHMKEGKGGEWVISNKSVFEWLKSGFSYNELRIGAVGIHANVLAELGIPLVIPHVYQIPERLAKLFANTGSILIPIAEDGEVKLKPPLEATKPEDEEIIHFIFEFKRDTTVRVGDGVIKVPCENRFIATWDEYLTEFKELPAFHDGLLSVIDEVDKAIVADFHLLRRKYKDGTTYLDKVQRAIEQISEWRERKPGLKVHFEFADIVDPKIREAVLTGISSVSDGLGVSKNQLLDCLEVLRCSDLVSRIRKHPSALCIYDGVIRLMGFLEVHRVIIHTRDFSVSLLKKDYGLTPDVEQDALLLGASCSATYAATGALGNLDRIAQVVKDPSLLHTSKEGIKQQRLLAEELDKRKIASRQFFLDEGIADSGDHWIIFVPSKVTDTPIVTVGLGDRMCAGVVAGEVA